MNFIPALLTPGADRGRSGKAFLNGKPEGVTLHYVGNLGSSAIANRNYFENGSGGSKVSAHYIVGLQCEIIQCVLENERAAHVGKSYAAQYDEMAKTNNARFLGIETCHPGADGKFSPVTYRSPVWLTVDICVRHGFDPRFSKVTRGCAPCWEDLNGKWAVPGNGYGENIVSMFGSALERYSDEVNPEAGNSSRHPSRRRGNSLFHDKRRVI